MEGIGWIVVLLGVLAVGYIFIEAVRWTVWAIGIFVLIGLFFLLFIKKYDETERAIIYRVGKFNRIAGPGWSIVVPFFEKEYQKVDVRTQVINISVNKAFTSEDLQIDVNGSVYYYIKDPEKTVLRIENYMKGLQDLIVSETRNIIASMSLRQLFANLDTLNDNLADQIRHSLWNWGLDVSMVQIRNISPANEIINAMKQKTISSEQLQATKFRAEARKILIEAVGEAGKSLDDKAVMYLYIKALEKIGQSSSTKLVVPMDMGGMGSGLGSGVGVGAGISLGGLSENEVVNTIKDKILATK